VRAVKAVKGYQNRTEQLITLLIFLFLMIHTEGQQSRAQANEATTAMMMMMMAMDKNGNSKANSYFSDTRKNALTAVAPESCSIV
jgi:hypothetical protein